MNYNGVFLSTSPLRGTTLQVSEFWRLYIISIHVPLAGDDFALYKSNTRIPVFLSTSPLRGTTPSTAIRSALPEHFYPRPPCGGRRYSRQDRVLGRYFYPRPPCGGRPPLCTIMAARFVYFYPRPPCGGRLRSAFWGGDAHAFLSTSPLRGTTLSPVH